MSRFPFVPTFRILSVASIVNFMDTMEMLVGLPTPTAVNVQMRVILQTNVHLLSKSAVTVKVLIPLSRAIAPRGNWKKRSAQ